MEKYIQAKKVWDSLSVDARRRLLKTHGRDSILSYRSYPYLPREVRADIQCDLLKQNNPVNKANPKPARHYWYQEI